MHVVCSYCQKSMPDKEAPPEQDNETSHGCCEECYPIEKEKVMQFLQRHLRQ